MYLGVEFMNNLKELRKRRSITQKMLAKQLKITQQALSLIENNKRKLTEDNIITICNTLKITPNDLIKW